MTPFDLTDGVVLLDQPRPGDADAVFNICQDPAIQNWTTVPQPYRREDAESYVSEFITTGWAENSRWTWLIRDIANGDHVAGSIGLMSQPVKSAELGFWLAPDARGRGLMTRAATLVVNAAFELLEFDRLEWRADEGNNPSRAVAERVGFRLEATIRGGSIARDTRRNLWVGTLLRDDRSAPPA